MKHMNCDEARERMSYYLDGTLLQQESEAFLNHIESCEDCGEELEQLKEILCLLSDIPESPVPDRFDLEFKRALRNEINGQREGADRKKKPIWKSMSAVAAVLVVGVLSFAMLNDGLSIGTKDLALQNGDGGAMPKSTDTPKPSGASASTETAISKDEDQQAACTYGVLAQSEPMQDEAADKSKSVPDMNYYRSASGAMGNPSGQTSSKEGNTEAYASPEAAEEETALNDSAPALTMPAAGDYEAGAGSRNGSILTDEAISRGTGSFSNAEEYNAACAEWIDQYTTAINSKDSVLFADIVAKAGINGYTTNTAENVLALYTDYLGDGTVTSKLLRSNSTKLENSYIIEGSRHKLKLSMKTTSAGLEVKEVLLNHGPWLSDQLSGTDYNLDTYEVRNGGDEVLFNIQFNTGGSGMTTDAEAEQQTKEIVWKKTE